MRQVVLRSGEVVLVTLADSYSGPWDCYARQHVNSTATWVQFPGGRWLRCSRDGAGRSSTYHVIRDLEACDSVAEAQALMGEQFHDPLEQSNGR
jgi:hypothetical protein